MAERKWEIGISGTFDVANYGDLLFPLIAEAELGKGSDQSTSTGSHITAEFRRNGLFKLLPSLSYLG
jgi:hypothetical protein